MARRRKFTDQVSTWKRQAVEGMADVFARGGTPGGPTEAEVKELHAKIGRLAVENDFLSQGLKRRARPRRKARSGATIPSLGSASNAAW